MSDDKIKTRPQDSARIDVNEDDERQYWSKQLGVSELELRDAVRDVGVSAERVREHLKRRYVHQV